MNKNIIDILLLFSIGFLSCFLILNIPISIIEKPFTGYFVENKIAPNETISRQGIELYEDKVIIYIENPGLGYYASTGSMLPTLNENTKGIRIVPKSEKEIEVGDIISFNKQEDLIIHRVVEKSQDELGTYFITRGDNADFSDGKIRFSEIKYKTIILVY